MADIVLIRPGCTDFDEQHRIQGSLDLPLNDRGERQVHDLAAQLRELRLDAIYTSPSEPARSTAQAIGEQLDVPVKQAEGLRNLDQGLWQGLQIDDIRKKYPKVFKQWKESPDTICPPEGEMAADALDRIRKALRKPLKRNGRFGVVASEPLATLVRCVVCGGSETPGPICGDGRMQPIEVLKVPQRSAADNGSDKEAKQGAVASFTRGENGK